MRVHIGSDHAGFELKQHLIDELTAKGYEVVDHGAPSYDAQDDYPVYCLPAAEAVVADPGSLGVVIGGSGNGEAIAAKRSTSPLRSRLERTDRDAGSAAQQRNVISVGGRMHTEDEATHFVELFLETPFSEDARHQRRIDLADRVREVPSG